MRAEFGIGNIFERSNPDTSIDDGTEPGIIITSANPAPFARRIEAARSGAPGGTDNGGMGRQGTEEPHLQTTV